MNPSDENYPEQSSGGRGAGKPPFRVLNGGQVPAGEPDGSPAHSAEAEQHVLACCLLDSAVMDRCQREKLVPDAFYFPANRLVFEVLSDLHRGGRPLTIEVLVEELKTRRQLEVVGGMPKLVEITSGIPTTAHAGYFIEKVREKFVLRKLDHFGRDLVEKTKQFTGGLDDFVSKYALRLQRWADFVTRCNRPSQADEAAEAKKAAEAILAGKVDKSRQLFIGLPYADLSLLPFDVANEDWLVVIGGPPSGGKSSLMRGIAGANCRQGKRGAIFLLETGKRRWLWSLAATLAQVNLRELLETPGRAFPEHVKAWQEWNAAIESWAGKRMWVFDDVYFLEDIERTVRELDRTIREKEVERLTAEGKDPATAHGLDFVLIDYLQLVPTREKIRVREEAVAHISRTLKRLLKGLNITGLVGAQLNRKSRDEERRPRLSDLRESGAIEQDADRVLALYTPANNSAGVPQTGDLAIDEVELLQLKSRNGPRDVAVDLQFFKRQTRYADMPRKGAPRPGAPKPPDGYKREGQS